MKEAKKKKSEPISPRWDVENFERKLEKMTARLNSINSSKNIKLDTGEPSAIQSKGNKNQIKIFEQFFLIGIPPSVTDSQNPNAKSKILIAYPPYEYSDIPTQLVIDSCMPTGNHRKYLANNPNSPIQDEFVFHFSGDLYTESGILYGVCVHVSTKDTSIPFYSIKKDKDRIFCFCLMTRNPSFSVHFSFLTFLALWTVGHIRNLRKKFEIQPPTFPKSELIDGLIEDDKNLKIGHDPSFEVPLSFQKEVVSYYIMDVTSPPVKVSRASSEFMQCYVSEKLERVNNKHHNFLYDNNDCSIELKFPSVNDINENSICWASLDTLFSLLKPSDILLIISYLCLNYQVLIIGSRLHEISMVIYALLSIIRPLNFEGSIIPILPNTEKILELLTTPVPYIYGVPRCNQLNDQEGIQLDILVDLDKKNVNVEVEIPPYPNSANIIHELNKLLGKLNRKHETNEFGFPPIYKKTLNRKFSFSTETCSKIREIISSPFKEILFSNYLSGFFVSGMGTSNKRMTVFNKELFIGQIEFMMDKDPARIYGNLLPNEVKESSKKKRIKSELMFWKNMIISQTFETFVYKKMNEFEKTNFQYIYCDEKESKNDTRNTMRLESKELKEKPNDDENENAENSEKMISKPKSDNNKNYSKKSNRRKVTKPPRSAPVKPSTKKLKIIKLNLEPLEEFDADEDKNSANKNEMPKKRKLQPSIDQSGNESTKRRHQLRRLASSSNIEVNLHEMNKNRKPISDEKEQNEIRKVKKQEIKQTQTLNKEKSDNENSKSKKELKRLNSAQNIYKNDLADKSGSNMSRTHTASLLTNEFAAENKDSKGKSHARNVSLRETSERRKKEKASQMDSMLVDANKDSVQIDFEIDLK